MAAPRTLLPVRAPYNLVRTLTCGQTFGWAYEGTVASGIFGGRRVRLEQMAEGIAVEGITDDIALRRLRHFLGVDEPLDEIEAGLRADRVLVRILPRTSGIAILRQDPWECLLGFIISTFNNIPKIELALHRLAARFGAPGPDGVRAIPRPEALARAPMRGLRACVLGYRAPYAAAVSRLVATRAFDLDLPGSLSYGDARRLLLGLPGVGEKVADCVLLFAYGKHEAFPVDVWVKRAVERWYFGGHPVSERRIHEFARQRFGPLAGYAQQHLFYAARTRARATRATR